LKLVRMCDKIFYNNHMLYSLNSYFCNAKGAQLRWIIKSLSFQLLQIPSKIRIFEFLIVCAMLNGKLCARKCIKVENKESWDPYQMVLRSKKSVLEADSVLECTGNRWKAQETRKIRPLTSYRSRSCPIFRKYFWNSSFHSSMIQEDHQ